MKRWFIWQQRTIDRCYRRKGRSIYGPAFWGSNLFT